MSASGEQLPLGGPWGPAVDVILCLLPLVFLVLTTLVGKIRLPTAKSLPMAALMMWLIRLAYLASATNYTNAAAIFGMFDAFTPMSISGGAILLFAAMESTQCMPWIMTRLKSLSQGHPVAEVMLITWAFEYLIEGASGFGTPVALAAPMMAQLGHSPFRTVACALIMNTLATPFGGVGTPIWFGFSGLVPEEEEQLFFTTISWKVQSIMTILAQILPIFAASFLVPFVVLKRNLLFIMLSIWSCCLPALGLSFFSYEFPSLLGGLVGVVITGVLAKFKIGLHPDYSEMDQIRAEHEQAEADDELEVEAATKSLTSMQGREASISYRGDDASVRSFLNRNFYVRTDFPSTFDPLIHPQAKHLTGNQVSMGVQTSSPSDDAMTSGPVVLANQETPLVEQALHNDRTDINVSMASAKGITEEPERTPIAIEALDVETPLGSGTEVAPVEEKQEEGNPIMVAIGRTFPLWATVLLLIITRVPAFHIKPLLRYREPSFEINLQNLFKIRMSVSLVLQIADILTEPLTWAYEILYVPSLIPFTTVSTISVLMFRKDIMKAGQKMLDPYMLTLNRVSYIIIPLIGALTMVSLIRLAPTSNGSPAYIIGYNLSSGLKQGWLAFICFMGALGSFFSGSTTTSNLTFGQVNMIAAETLGLSQTSLLAMQCAGATLGNAICINNIISAKTVVGLISTQEGAFIAKTGPITMAALVAATGLGALFVYTLPDTL